MSTRQLTTEKSGILIAATRLHDRGVSFDHWRVRQVLDSAFLLSRQGVPEREWAPLWHAILALFGQPTIHSLPT